MKQAFNPELWLIDRKPFDPRRWIAPRRKKSPAKQVSHNKRELTTGEEVDLVISQIEENRLDLTSEHKDWISIGFALAEEFGEAGRSRFHRVSRFYPEYNSTECDKQFDRCLKNGKSGATIKTFFFHAFSAGIRIHS